MVLLHNKYVSILYNYGSAKDFQDGRAETKKLWYTCEFTPSFFFSIYNQDNKKKQKSKMMATFSTFVLVCVIDKKSYNVTRFRKNDNNSVYFPFFFWYFRGTSNNLLLTQVCQMNTLLYSQRKQRSYISPLLLGKVSIQWWTHFFQTLFVSAFSKLWRLSFKVHWGWLFFIRVKNWNLAQKVFQMLETPRKQKNIFLDNWLA